MPSKTPKWRRFMVRGKRQRKGEVRTCDLPGCDGKHQALGWCMKHYTRYLRNGDPLASKTQHYGAGDRFLKSVLEREPTDECIGWPLYKTDSGYGLMHIGGNGIHAHKRMLQLMGEDMTGKVSRHKCKSKDCVNPLHLESGTQRQNVVDDRWRDGTMSRKNTNGSALTIRLQRYSGARRMDLAKRFDVNGATIKGIADGRTWKHLPSAKAMLSIQFA